jgi:RNA polymerase sigma factor (sigma-70 family)
MSPQAIAVRLCYDGCALGKVTVDETEELAVTFEDHRPHLRAVAYRMLGSVSEAEDAVQETWLRLSRSDTSDVQNLRAWLTTVVARVCLDMLRTRSSRREDPLDVHVPDPIVTSLDGSDPEREAVLVDSVGLALLVVLETLSPAERLAFVLHDVFAVPFDQIATLLDRSPAAAKQLASRARRRVQGASPPPDTNHVKQQEVVDAFLAASRDGDFEGLLAVLHPDIVLRADAGSAPIGPSQIVRGARSVAAQALRFADLAQFAHRVLVNGAPGLIAVPNGHPAALLSATVRGGLIVEIDILADPDRLSRLDLTAIDFGDSAG